MNKFFKTTTALLALSALVACGEDAAMDESLNLSNGKALERISITGKDFQIDGATRSSVVVDNAGVNFLWEAGDVVGIFPNTGDQVSFAMDEGAGMQTATFNGGGWALKASSTYAAYYPYDFYNRDITKIPVSYEHQTQTGNASTAHLGAYDFMAASVTTPTNGIVAFDMQHMGALVMLQADLDEAKTLTGVSVKANSDVFTTTGVVDLTAVTPSIAAKTTTSILALPLNDFTVSANETSTIYFMMVPANLEGETLEVKLFYKGGSGIKYEIVGKNFVAGKAYGYTLTDGENLNHPEYAVDLGLPSGTLWADRNVGADSPEAYGDYFAWGETEPKDYYSWTTYKWGNGTMTKYCTRSSYGTVDGKTVLDLEDDAACVNMGIEWRMPTLDEFKELYNNCSWTWTTLNGVKVYKVTGPNNNSIILPAAGYRSSSSLSLANSSRYYWSSSLYEPSPNSAYSFCNQSSAYNWRSEARCYGQSVRAVVR
jgi:hypothetical protein